jgi:hypothetical protein
MTIIPSTRNGSCFFSSILSLLTSDYPVGRKAQEEFTTKFRKALASKYTQQDYDDVYDVLKGVYGNDREKGYIKMKKNIANPRAWLSLDATNDGDAQCLQFVCKILNINVWIVKDGKKLQNQAHKPIPDADYVFVSLKGNHFEGMKLGVRTIFEKNDEIIVKLLE